jgi:hypothetical protein
VKIESLSASTTSTSKSSKKREHISDIDFHLGGVVRLDLSASNSAKSSSCRKLRNGREKKPRVRRTITLRIANRDLMRSSRMVQDVTRVAGAAMMKMALIPSVKKTPSYLVSQQADNSSNKLSCRDDGNVDTHHSQQRFLFFFKSPYSPSGKDSAVCCASCCPRQWRLGG